MSYHVVIIGAGLIGRLLALELHLAGASVALLDRDSKEGKHSCAYTGAGMLAPYAELEISEPIIAALGIESLSLWPQILKKLPQPVFFQEEGTLVLAHPQDQAELIRFKSSVQFRLENGGWQKLAIARSDTNVMFDCNQPSIIALEAELPRIFTNGIYLPNEGQIDNKQLLEALRTAIEQANIPWHTDIDIASVSNRGVECKHLRHHSKNVVAELKSYDFIIDCRGLGSKKDIAQLRGVRGELLLVEAPDVRLKRPIRLMHPRHPIYIVPRENNRFIIGATTIESEDMRPLTVQSALELLSAACTVHPGFAEASILESRVNCRPAMPNNLPAIILPEYTGSPKIIGVNGLYRHGFLIAPKIANLVLAYIMNKPIDDYAQSIFHKGDPVLAISH